MSNSDKLGWFTRMKVAFGRKKNRSKQPTFMQKIKLFWKPKANGSVAPAVSANATVGRRQLNNRPRSFQAGRPRHKKTGQLTAEQECLKLFDEYDKDGDKQLNVAEISTFLDACAKDNGGLLCVLGAHLTGMTRAQLKSLSKSPPVQGIEIAEFMRAFTPVHNAFSIFCQFDTDGDRQLNLLEYKKLLRAMGAATDMDRKSFATQSRNDFNQIDTDGDKRVGFPEFWTYFKFMHHVDQPRAGKLAASAPASASASTSASVSGAFEERSLHAEPRKAKPKKKKPMGHVTSMEDACRQGDLFAAQMFLERGDTVCIGGLPPVVIAAMSGHADLVAFLIQARGLDPSLLESEREAVLVACHAGDERRMQMIVKDLYTHATQRTAMLDALTSGNVDVARASMKRVYYKRMGEKKKLKNDRVSEHGKVRVRSNAKLGLQLAVAAKNKQFRKALELLNSKADPDWVDESGSTALMHATWSGWLNIVDLLLERGADVTISNRRGNTPLHFAAEKTHVEVVYSILGCPGGMDCLGFENAILKRPADLCSSPFLREVLSQASVIAQQEAQRHVVNKDFRHVRLRATQKDGYLGKGHDWITRTCRDGDLKSLQHCVKTDMGSVHLPDPFGISPLMHAVYSGSLDIVKYLVEDHKVDVKYKTHYGNNCLHYLYERIKEHKNKLDEQAKWFKILRYICAHGGEQLKTMHNLHGQVPKDFTVVHSGDVMKKSFSLRRASAASR